MRNDIILNLSSERNILFAAVINKVSQSGTVGGIGICHDLDPLPYSLYCSSDCQNRTHHTKVQFSSATTIIVHIVANKPSIVYLYIYSTKISFSWPQSTLLIPEYLKSRDQASSSRTKKTYIRAMAGGIP